MRFGIRRAYTSGPTMVVASACLAAASIGFIFALKNTTVANAAFLASLAPLLAAVLARAVLGERISGVTVVAVGTVTNSQRRTKKKEDVLVYSRICVEVRPHGG